MSASGTRSCRPSWGSARHGPSWRRSPWRPKRCSRRPGLPRHGHLTVLDLHRPRAGAIDLEDIGVGHPRRLEASTRDGSPSKNSLTVSDMSRAYLTARRPRARGAQSSSWGAGGSTGTSAINGDDRGDEESRPQVERVRQHAQRNSRHPAQPDREPIDQTRGHADVTRQVLLAITIVTPKVEITITPTKARQIAPGTPPARTKTNISGAVAAVVAVSTGRLPKRSAAGTGERVPMPPPPGASARAGGCRRPWNGRATPRRAVRR